MPTVEGSMRSGWLVLFTADETKQIAEPVGDYAGPIAALGALAPEPVVTKVISLGAAGLTFVAKRAAKEDRLLGIYIRSVNPFRHMFWYLRIKEFSDLPGLMYTNYGSMLIGCAPFVYNEKDPKSLEKWRRIVGI
jgi:hypothetical protein